MSPWISKDYHRDYGPFDSLLVNQFFHKYQDIEVLQFDIDDGEPVDITFYYVDSHDPHGPSCTDSDSDLYDDLCYLLDSD